MTDAFRILFVCTGNVCRSAMAEVLVRTWIDEFAPDIAQTVQITGAGTAAPQGAPMSPPAQQLLRELGTHDPATHSAQTLTKELVAEADLILTATRQHRSDTVRILPRAARNIFTIIEFAELAGRVPAQRLSTTRATAEEMRQAVRTIAGQRGRGRGDCDQWDIEDPIGRSITVYQNVLAIMQPALVQGVSAVLGRELAQPEHR